MSNGHGGRRVGAGRPKGRLNNDSIDIRALILGALEDVGGRAYLADQAVKSPSAFMGLVAKVLPTQLISDPDRPLAIRFEWGPAQQPEHGVTIPLRVGEADDDQPQIQWQDPQ